MQKLVVQGGPGFKTFFEPLRLQISTTKELEGLLRYYFESERLKWDLCQTAHLDTDPDKCEGMLERPVIRRILPNRRRANNLAFAPTKRIAPFEIARFLSEGSVRSWVERLATSAGNPKRDNADGYLAKQILITGLTLACLLDECHPDQVLYLGAVERLVRALVVMEEAVEKEKTERGKYLVEMMSFLGIGGGVTRQTAELL